jgi:hypothetical protein
MVNVGSCCHQSPSLHCRFEFQEKKKVTLLDMGDMENAGHGFAVFSFDSHTQTKQSDLLHCNGVLSPMHCFCDFFSHISFQRGYRILE